MHNHGIHHPTLPRSHKSTDRASRATLEDPNYEKHKEEEKHQLCQWEGHQREPLSPSEIAKDPTEKHVGKSSKYLRKEDFKLMKTIGTGTTHRR